MQRAISIKNFYNTEHFQGLKNLGNEPYQSHKIYIENLINAIVTELNAAIRAGTVTLPSESDTETPTPPATPTTATPTTAQQRQSFSQKLASRNLPAPSVPSRKVGSKRVGVKEDDTSTFDKLNLIFESIMEEMDAPISIKQWVLNRFREYNSDMLEKYAAELEKSWNNRKAKAETLNKLANYIYTSTISGVRNRMNSANAGSSPQTTQNKEQSYTKSLVDQINKMTPEYKDDIPIIVNALLQKLAQVDKPSYDKVITDIKKASTPTPTTTTTESKKGRK
jgi:hypothetical protein